MSTKNRNPLIAALPTLILAAVFFVLGQVLVRAIGPGWDEIGTGLAGFAVIAAVLIAVNRLVRQHSGKS
jgi:hypothetical protein